MAAISLTVVPASAEPLKVMSWNIANLAQEAGVSLRGGHVRTEDDMQVIRDTIAKRDPDIIALQEIGSISGARNVLGNQYEVAFESRCGEFACEADQGEIFTAIAWKKSLEVDMDVIHLDALSEIHVSECQYNSPRPVRGGVGLSFTFDAVAYKVLSVHLKASCAREENNDVVRYPDLSDDCLVLDKQFNTLNKWIKDQSFAGYTVVVGGDFNRFLLDADDRYPAVLRATNPTVRIEPATESQCWPRNYPQSRSLRAKLAREAFAEVGPFKWQPYMPSSIGSRDFFIVSGPETRSVSAGAEILLRPDPLVHDPEPNNAPEAQRAAIEQQALAVGVRIGPPDGYLEACMPPSPNETAKLPLPQPFPGGNTVLSFAPVFPSDHCPIEILIGN